MTNILPILVIDDDISIRKLLHLLLEEAGYTVISAIDGTEGLGLVASKRFSLIILDWMLPDISGIDVCRSIKQENPLLPVLAISARGDARSIVSMLDSGADDYLPKPIELTELLARMRVLMRRATLYTDTREEDENSVTMHFGFPDIVNISCQQYLLYFVEFLRDIGIDATADLQEDAGQVLFSVTPKDKDEALDNIREALAIYLRLPMSRNTTVVVSPDTSIEVQKLSAQLHHFQGQLYLASAALQQKELTIQQQGTTIHYQQSLIEQQIASGQVLVQALQKEAEDAEPVGGIVKVKAWSIDGIPIELDLPTLMRQLKERFRRKRIE